MPGDAHDHSTSPAITPDYHGVGEDGIAGAAGQRPTWHAPPTSDAPAHVKHHDPAVPSPAGGAAPPGRPGHGVVWVRVSDALVDTAGRVAARGIDLLHRAERAGRPRRGSAALPMSTEASGAPPARLAPATAFTQPRRPTGVPGQRQKL